jgi:hypothetical protein
MNTNMVVLEGGLTRDPEIRDAGKSQVASFGIACTKRVKKDGEWTNGIFVDGTGVTPGSERCKCTAECEFPCWQRIGIAPACSACKCPPLEELDA